MKPTALDKRIKRRITARRHTFFAACAPGLSRVCMHELQELSKTLPLDAGTLSMVTGGMEFQGQIHDAYAANLCLRSPSRILMRIKRFRAENFRILEKQLKDMDWELYLKPGVHIAIQASSQQSRLYHGGALAQRARDIIGLQFDQPLTDASGDSTGQGAANHTIYLRGDKDWFDVSLDTSGELLYRRGIKPDVGAAPLRETLAVAILGMAGYTGEEPLLDPMCGSGTFSLEGVMIRRNIPPGFFRSFAFQDWPCFSQGRWNHMKGAAQALIQQNRDTMIVASDRDASMLSALKATLCTYPLLSGIRVIQQDFFDLAPGHLVETPGVVVLNPPYGIRLGTREDMGRLYLEIGKKLGRDFRGWKIGVVLPDPGLADRFPFPVCLTPLFHGGLELSVATGRVP
ncbi:MAG: RNA methyltransferase [Pseudomonadota bacterium]